jgi:hypothetical protein
MFICDDGEMICTLFWLWKTQIKAHILDLLLGFKFLRKAAEPFINQLVLRALKAF